MFQPPTKHNFNMSQNCVYYRGKDAIKKVSELQKENIWPFPEAFAQMKAYLNEPRESTERSIEWLEDQIESQKLELEGVEKMLFYAEHALPYYLNINKATKNEMILASCLRSVLFCQARGIENACHFLQNDLYSKKIQLEKRRQKRKRYSENKKKCLK